MNVAKTFKETLISSLGSSQDSPAPIVATLIRQPDNTQRFIGEDQDKQPSSASSLITKQHASATGTETNYYRRNVATAGSIVHCYSESHSTQPSSHLPQSISWRLFENSSVIELEPVDLNYRKNYQHRSIKIVSPSPVFESCIAVSYNPSLFKLVIDFISQDWSFYTIAVSLSDFLFDPTSSLSDGGNLLTERNASNWHRLSTSFPFDIKQPHLIHAVTSNLLIISLKNGSLMKIFRDAPLNDFSWDVISDPTSSTLTRIWRGQSDKCPTDKNVSIRTAISISSVPSNKDLLLTVSINHKLRIWQISTSNLLFDEFLASSDNVLLGPSPMNVLSVLDAPHDPNEFFFATYNPTDSGLIQAWRAEISTNSEELSLAVQGLGPKYAIEPYVPDDTSTWLVNSFHIAKHTSNSFIITTMLKSNTSSAIYKAELPRSDSSSSVWQVAIAKEDTDALYLKASASHAATQTDSYIKWLFGPEGYLNVTIEAALQIYSTHYALGNISSNEVDDDESDREEEEEERANHTSLWLRKKVCKTVGSAVTITYSSDSEPDYEKYRNSLAHEWARFDRLCAELERLGNEVLSMTWDPVTNTFWVTKSSFTSVLRSALPVELIYYNRALEPSAELVKVVTSAITSSPSFPSPLSGRVTEVHISQLLRLVDALYTYRKTLSTAQYGLFINTFKEDFHRRPHFSTEERISHIRSSLIDEVTSRDALMNLFRSITEATPGTFYHHLDLVYRILTLVSPLEKPASGTNISVPGAVFLSSALYENIVTSKVIVSDILITLTAALPLGESNIDKHTQFYSKYLGLLNSFEAVYDFLHTIPAYQAKSSAKRIANGHYKPEDVPYHNLTFFQQLLLKRQSGLFVLTSSSFPRFISHLASQLNVTCQPTAIAQIIAELLSTSNNQVAHEFTTQYLPRSGFSSFIAAHVFVRDGQADKAVDQFRAAAIDLSTRHLTTEEMAVVKKLPGTTYTLEDSPLSSFGNGLAKYFNDAATTVNSWGTYSVRALQLARLARANLYDPISNIDSATDIEPAIALNKVVQKTLFDLAIKAASLDDAYSALVELDMLHNFEEDGTDSNPFEIETKIAPFVEQISTLAVETGNIGRLAQYPFIGVKDVVTAYFVDRAKAGLASIVAVVSQRFGGRVSNGNVSTNVEGITRDAFVYYHSLYSWAIEHQDFRGGMFHFFFFFFFSFTDFS